MIHERESNEKSENIILRTIKSLNIAKIMREAGIKKSQGASPFEVLKFLLLLVFHQKNLYRFLESERKDEAFSKNTYYRFLNEPTYNWRRFLLLLSTKVITRFNGLTIPKRVKAFVLDDSFLGREKSKKVELLAKVFDHTGGLFKKGFTLLTLGWTDGYSLIPVDFTIHSSTKKSNRHNEVNSEIDKRCNGYKRRKESLEEKPYTALKMIKRALDQGISASYVLMDTWFTHGPLIKGILDLGLDVIGMVKDVKQKYTYKDTQYTLNSLKRLVKEATNSNIKAIVGSLIVQTKEGLQVKLVFVKNRNNKKEFLVLLSTDLFISDEEVVRIYGNRWSIEVFFKSIKSFMKLGSEFQGRSFDLMISHTTIVFTRYIILEMIKREQNDFRTFGELAFAICDEVQDMDFKTALQGLLTIFDDLASKCSSKLNSFITCQLKQWIDLQPAYIRALFPNFIWES